MPIMPWSPFLPREEREDLFKEFFKPAPPSAPIIPPVDISVKDNVLTVKGKMEKKIEVEEKNYYRKEIRAGSFYRSLPLPAPVIGEKAKAESSEGMLHVSIPKAPGAKKKVVKVKVRTKKQKNK